MSHQTKTRSLDDRIQALKRKLEKKTWWWLVSISYCCWLAQVCCFHDIQSKQRIKRDESSIKRRETPQKKPGESSLLFPWTKLVSCLSMAHRRGYWERQFQLSTRSCQSGRL
jgi:hypothetical protein